MGDERKLLPERHFNALKKLIFDRKSLQKSPIVDIATTTVTPEYISESFLHFFVQALYQMDNYVSFDPTNPNTPNSIFNVSPSQVLSLHLLTTIQSCNFLKCLRAAFIEASVLVLLITRLVEALICNNCFF